MIHFQRWFISMATVLAVYLVYAVAIAPRLEPPPRKAKLPITVVGEKPIKQRDFTHLFPADAWQNNDPKVIETESALLLFQDYQPQPDGKLDVTPCTVLMFPGKDADSLRRPIVLDAPAGAVIEFDRELDLANMKVGELLGGTLTGDIRIFRIPSSPIANDGLELTTRNVVINPQKVWTPHEVKFRYGPSYGSGRDLTIQMLPQDKTAGISAEKGSLGALQRMQLAIVDVIHFEPPAQGLAGNSTAAAPTGEPKPILPAAPLEIRCRGAFEFDFVEQVGSFEKNVEVLQLNPLGQPDSLRCQYLGVRLRKPAELEKTTTAAPITPVANTAGPLAGMSADKIKSQLASIEATGEQVILNAPSQGIYVSGARLAYDFITQQINLTPGPQSPQVTLAYGQQSFVARQLRYDLLQTGRLGNLWAEGPGEARLVQTQEKQPQAKQAAPMRISWERELKLGPDPKSAAKVLSILGKAQAAAENMGSFSADEIHVWLRELPPPAVPPPASANASPLAGIEPDRLLATGRVEIDTPQFVAHTRQFEAWFVNPPPVTGGPALVPVNPTIPTIPVNPATALPPVNNSTRLPATNSFPRVTTRYQPLSTPVDTFDNRDSPLNPLEPLPAEQPASRFDITGDLIRAQVLRQAPSGVVDELAVTGNVRVVETQIANPSDAPLTMQGDTLQMKKGSTADAVVQIVGQPAVVTARGMKLVGASVQLQRGENRVWIDGPGEAEVPLSREFFAPPGVPQIPQGPAAEASQIAKVLWKGGAKFDGQTLTVAKNVVARTEHERQLLMAELLTVTLDRYVDFQKSLDRPPQVATLKVDGGVFLQNRTLDERLNQVSFDQFQVKNFSVDQRTGRIDAEGPGWLSSARIGGSTVPGSPAQPPAAFAPPNEELKLTFLRVTFQGNIVGSITNREIQFQRQVRTVVGPIAKWEDKFDPTNAAELGENGVVLVSDKMTVSEMRQANVQQGPQQSAMEFEAAGNVLVEGKGVVAKAQRIRYATAKEQLIVEGEGRTPAELWYRSGPGKPEAYQSARKIKFSRRLSSIEVEDAQSIDLNQINGPAPKVFGGR